MQKSRSNGAINELLYREAQDFIELMVLETGGRSAGTKQRLHEIRDELAKTETYTHTTEELAFGAKVAWRNSNRCIGRLFWRSMDVFDHRGLNKPDDIFYALESYLKQATNGGRIRPSICIFAPRHPKKKGEIRILNNKLIRYAGYETTDGIVGDPEEVEITRLCEKLGWKGNGTAFDVLPVAIQITDREPELFELSPEAVLQVPIEHPDLTCFAELGLKWYAVPVISNMVLEIGGIEYPAAPFNGWFMGTEIGSRNLGDENRYNMLPKVARCMNLDTNSRTSLWKDRALVELNAAVLHSYKKAGVMIVDHHTASDQFMRFVEQEQQAGRDVTSEWSWIVPPMSGSATQVFHHEWPDEVKSPGYFYRDKMKD